MTTPADGQQPEDDEEREDPTIRFLTPNGVFDDIADLPPSVRTMLAQSLDSVDLPDELRAVLEAGLATAAERDSDLLFDASAGRDAHREQVWGILDTAFPNEPHLWQAGEALFTLSASNPDEVDDETRRIALTTMALHLQRHAALTSTANNPVDQLVAKFRQQMGNL